jgi:cytosine/adenosine deaminase-related metal-dependent hydrolase
MQDIVSQLVYSAQSTGVDVVVVGGRVVLQGGKATQIDELEAYERIDRAGRNLFRRMGWQSLSRWPTV